MRRACSCRTLVGATAVVGGRRPGKTFGHPVQHGPVESHTDPRAISSSRRYRRHRPEQTSLYPIVERHLSTLRDELQHHETALPRFVLNEFQDYLRCGLLEYVRRSNRNTLGVLRSENVEGATIKGVVAPVQRSVGADLSANQDQQQPELWLRGWSGLLDHGDAHR